MPNIKFEGISVTGENGKIDYAYNAHGSAFPLTVEEKKLNLDQVIDLIKKTKDDGNTRCTTCLATIKESDVAGYPLFAGVNCATCWEKHLERAKTERKCSLCGKPISFCCC